MTNLNVNISLAVLLVLLPIDARSQFQHSGPIDSGRVFSLLVTPSEIYTAIFTDRVFYSTNNGTSWIPTGDDLINKGILSLAINSDYLFAGTDGMGVFRSTDNGANWSASSSGFNMPINIYSLAARGSNLFAGTHGYGIFSSTNNGDYWYNTNPDAGIVSSIVLADSHVFTTSYGRGVFRSTDNGVTWILLNSGLINKYAISLAMSGSHLFVGTHEGGVFTSSNNGESWSQVNTGLKDLDVSCFAVSEIGSDTASIFAGTTNGGIYLSTNFGSSWTAVNAGLPNEAIHALATDSLYLFAGNHDTGVWRRPLSEIMTSVNSSSVSTPISFRLEQNFPNPFNSSTRIKFSLSHATFVTLKMYDVLGQELALLASGEYPAGTYSANWLTNNFSNGVYFCHLRAGIKVQTMKLVLMR